MSAQVFQIQVKDSNLQFKCPEGERLLLAMQRVGVSAIPVGCKGGGCGVCRVKVLQGEYELGKVSRKHVSSKLEKDGYALSCRLVPRSDLVLQLETINQK